MSTSEDFGTQGDQPQHPELLDWLATELVAAHWDTKALLRLLVTSAAYRQSSQVTPALVERDPDNRLLARGPRFRLSAEVVRDQALAVSGLLSPKMYGPPVRPAQPDVRLDRGFRRHDRLADQRGRGPLSPRACTRPGGGRIRIRRWPRSTLPTARCAPCAGRAPTRRCRPW